MNKLTLSIFLIITLFLVACEVKETTIVGNETTSTKIECQTDNDCVTGGCSGTICQSKDAEPIFTTCEYLPEYACYKEIDCAYINGKCQWKKTERFDACVENARKSSGEVIV